MNKAKTNELIHDLQTAALFFMFLPFIAVCFIIGWLFDLIGMGLLEMVSDQEHGQE